MQIGSKAIINIFCQTNKRDSDGYC